MATDTTLDIIHDFLAQKRLAVVGVSREPKDFTRGLFQELINRNYDVVPVNPQATEIDGRPCVVRVQDITPPVDGALILTPPEVTITVVQDCAEAQISRIWLHRGMGSGAVSDEAVALCREHGMQVIPGFCPFMFWQDSGFVHRIHRAIARVTGNYPS